MPHSPPVNFALVITMKLLIVDDNPQMRQMMRLILADVAEAIIECSDGDEALATYVAQQFSSADRVVMDLQMLRVGGIEATRRIRAVFPDAHIIIVTQYNDLHWRAAATNVGACGYVLKEDLFALRQILKPKQD